MATGNVPATWLAAIKTQLTARLAGNVNFNQINVFLIPPNTDLPLHESIVLWAGDIQGEDSYALMGRQRDEVSVIPGVIYTAASDPNEATAMNTAMARAASILDEIAFEIRDNPPLVGLQTRAALVSGHKWKPALLDDGTWLAELRFDVTVKARVA